MWKVSGLKWSFAHTDQHFAHSDQNLATHKKECLLLSVLKRAGFSAHVSGSTSSTAAAYCQVFLTYSDLAKGNAMVLYSQLIVQHLLEALHQLADVMN